MRVQSLLLIMCVLQPLSVDASIVELKFQGFLGSPLGTFDANPFPGTTPFTENMPFFLAMIFDTNSTDITYDYTTPEGYSQTDYRAVSTVTVDVGGYKVFSQGGQIQINNALETNASGDVDAWTLVVEKGVDAIIDAPTVAGLELGLIAISLHGSPTVFSSTDLVIPSLAELNHPFPGRTLWMDFGEGGDVRNNPNSLIRGTITSIEVAQAPEPESCTLILLGLGLVRAFEWRKKLSNNQRGLLSKSAR